MSAADRPGSDTAAPHVWAISDGAAGNARQALALAAALGVEAEVKRIALRAPWRWVAPRGLRGAQRAFEPALQPPWPDLAIGCGRHAALATRALRAWSGARTFTVQILDPRIDPAAFDVVIAPRHDGLHGPNVIETLGSLNPIDDAWLAAGRAAFAPLAGLPPPLTALLVGGPRRGAHAGTAAFAAFVAPIARRLEREGGTLLVTVSRRTPPAWRAHLHGAFASGCVQFWDGPEDGPNPYAGYLAHAARIAVTPDSVNMLSEACAVGVPVLSRLPRGARGRLAAFHAGLRDAGRLFDLDDPTPGSPPAPLRETATVAAEVRRRWDAQRAANTGAPTPST